MRKFFSKWRRSALAAAIGVAMLALALTGAKAAVAAQLDLPAHFTGASIAAAAPNAIVIATWQDGLQDWQTQRCLDSNTAGAVYTNPCQVPGNQYQDWTITEWESVSPTGAASVFYSYRDVATNRCLDSNTSGNLYTNPCQVPGNTYQTWLSPGDSHPDALTGLCLDSNTAGSAYTHACNGGNYQVWVSP